MSSASSLSEDQIATVRAWAADGDGLSDIQKRLDEELSLKFTYLETRFLLEDLKIELLPPPVEEPEPEPDEDSAEALPGEAPLGAEAPLGGVAVTVDRVQRPGALISGSASFAGGETATWWLDQAGRLSFDPANKDFRPSEDQMLAFQKELQRMIQSSGL